MTVALAFRHEYVSPAESLMSHQVGLQLPSGCLAAAEAPAGGALEPLPASPDTWRPSKPAGGHSSLSITEQVLLVGRGTRNKAGFCMLLRVVNAAGTT